MNWFTSKDVSNVSLAKKEEYAEENDACEHVIANPGLMTSISYENDSFGREGYCMCDECKAKSEEEESDRDVVCCDCHLTMKAKETISWKWYDFYAAQGDEAMIVCNNCQRKDKHKARVRQDALDRDEELGRY
jgi:hypothetical protein